MRDNLETREIADNELDAVAGGIVGINGGLAGAVTSDVAGLSNSQTLQAVQGLAAGAPALAQQVTGVQVNTAQLGL